MKAIEITEQGIISFYGNRAGYVRRDTAYLDPMFEKDELIEYLKEERSLQVSLQESPIRKTIMSYLTEILAPMIWRKSTRF